jgi:predicted metalloprotease with PDZ domain
LRVDAGSPAQEAGLQAGDILVALNGQEIANYQDAISIVRGMRPGEELQIIFERARTEREALALLDAKPGVRTATRPGDVRVEQQYVPNDGSGDTRIDVNRRDDYNRTRDGRYDEGGRRILPRLRN